MGTCARLLIAALLTTSSGCMFAEAGYRSANDDRRHGRYASKSYGQHLLDATFEPSPPRERRRARCHCHGHCNHRG
ncbi:MAG: hypothetical protein KDD82_13835 [Planctomycetes bacterium]|nr:hypothetical protein [Planctomycetota bacterium]